MTREKKIVRALRPVVARLQLKKCRYVDFFPTFYSKKNKIYIKYI